MDDESVEEVRNVQERHHWIWLFASAALFLVVVAGVLTEAGPTGVIGAILVGATLYGRTHHWDVARLFGASACFLTLGAAASFLPTASGCGLPLIESAQHSTEPTPHVHGPCEQANDRRALAGTVLIIGAGLTTFVARRRQVAERAAPAS